MQVMQVGDQCDRMGPDATGSPYVGEILERRQTLIVVMGIPPVANKDPLPFAESIEEPASTRQLSGGWPRSSCEPRRIASIGPIDAVGIGPGGAGQWGSTERVSRHRRLDPRRLRRRWR